MNDQEIIDLYFARNEQAIAETATQYGGLCYTVANQILHSQPDSEECVNDTYLKTWNSIPPQRPNRLAAFLCRITRNLALDCYRRDHRQKRNADLTVSLSELEACIPAPDEATDDLLPLLNGFLGSLPETEWQLFCGRYWHNTPVATLARVHGLTPKAVTMRLARTREKLKRYLEERGYHV